MIEAYKDFWKKYADFNGKSTRSDYWYVVLMNVLISFAMGFVVSIALILTPDELASEASSELSAGGILSLLILLVLIVYGLASIVPTVAISVRRLRDANLPWPLIFLGFVPFFGGIILFVLFCQPSVSQSTNNDETDEM